MTDERERREFNAGLSEEVDAWLRGDTSRREFLTRFMLLGGAAMLPGLGYTASGSKAWAAMADVSKVELADKSTPLGQTQAAAVKASSEGPTDGSAYRAVQAAQQYKDKGITLNLTYEAGLQALEPKNFSGPLWQALTGINFDVVELPHPDQYSKPIAEHIAGSGAYDVLDIEPAWIPALANGGVILPIDDYVAKYMNKADLDDYHPLYKSITMYKGKQWGVFDDGDQFALYYRKDVFDDPKLKAAYQGKFGKPLAVPTTWDDYTQVAQFITDQLAPNIYGAAHFRKFGSPGNQFSFLQQFRANGGKFFDADLKSQLTSSCGRNHAQSNDRAEQSVNAGQQRSRRRRALGGMAAGQGCDDFFLAADRPDVVELCPARQGNQLHSPIDHRRQGWLCRGARRQWRDGVWLRTCAGGRVQQRRGSLSLHAVGHCAAALSRAHYASVHIA